ISAAEGAGTGAVATATFTDPGGAEALTNYGASISWGDGQSSPGTISYDATSHVFTVSTTSHTYAEEGVVTVTTTVTHDAAADTSDSQAFTVSDPAVVVTEQAISAAEGAGTGTVTTTTFTDPGGAEATGDYAATIN